MQLCRTLQVVFCWIHAEEITSQQTMYYIITNVLFIETVTQSREKRCPIHMHAADGNFSDADVSRISDLFFLSSFCICK